MTIIGVSGRPVNYTDDDYSDAMIRAGCGDYWCGVHRFIQKTLYNGPSRIDIEVVEKFIRSYGFQHDEVDQLSGDVTSALMLLEDDSLIVNTHGLVMAMPDELPVYLIGEARIVERFQRVLSLNRRKAERDAAREARKRGGP